MTACLTACYSVQASADATQQQAADLRLQLETEQQAGGELGAQLTAANMHVGSQPLGSSLDLDQSLVLRTAGVSS